jgi:hypothetical protein
VREREIKRKKERERNRERLKDFVSIDECSASNDVIDD